MGTVGSPCILALCHRDVPGVSRTGDCSSLGPCTCSVCRQRPAWTLPSTGSGTWVLSVKPTTSPGGQGWGAGSWFQILIYTLRIPPRGLGSGVASSRLAWGGGREGTSRLGSSQAHDESEGHGAARGYGQCWPELPRRGQSSMRPFCPAPRLALLKGGLLTHLLTSRSGWDLLAVPLLSSAQLIPLWPLA